MVHTWAWAISFTSWAIKNIFHSHLRTFEGHCLWDALSPANELGASVMYYCGSQRGSGISGQYLQTETAVIRTGNGGRLAWIHV
jgi:hypothetical protein